MNCLDELEASVQHCRFLDRVRGGLDLSSYSRESSDPSALPDSMKVC